MAKKDELNFETDNKMASSEKLKALQAAMEKIEKSFGKGSIMKMGDDSVEQVEVIPTGSIDLNVALGVGGYPRGRIIEIYGPESSGKTTLAIHAIAEAQKAGGIAAFIDAEHAFDRFYASKLGVNIDDLYISQPDNGEQALEIAEQLIRSSAIDIIVIDSVAALTPKAEIEGDMGDNKVGLQARLMSQALRKLTAAVSKTRTTCIFINQLREKIGVMFGNPERRRYFILHYFYLSQLTENLFTIFDRLTTTDIQTYGSIELQSVTTSRCFRVTEHNADLLTQLVDENTSRTCLAHSSRQLTESLRHHVW